jgi:aryl-alcohol dehydrogenase-like predicted oxidoreductase
MLSRRFGNTDLSVSAIGFGCARIGGIFESAGRKATVGVLQRAVDEGIRLFDTEDMYAQGNSERLLGEALKGRRDRVVIATKFGYVVPSSTRWASRVKPLLKPIVVRLGRRARAAPKVGAGQVWLQDFSPAHIQASVEASLRRLHTDYLDIYQLHSPPRDALERAEFVESLERLRQQGKIRYWGVACERPDDVSACLRLPSLASLQIGVNVLEQDAVDTAIPLARSHGVGVIGRQVFASGLLTRPLEDINPRYVDSEAKRQHLERFAAIVEATGRSRSELAIQYALNIDGVSVVLVGVSRMDQLEHALSAYHARGLADEEHNLITGLRTVRQSA